MTLTVFHIVVPIVYWALLSSSFLASNPDPTQWWTDVSLHGIEFALIYVDMIFNKLQVFVTSPIIVAALILSYMFLTWIVHAGT